MEKSKVLLIGLDGGTWDVIDPLIAEGVMPTMQRLKQEGTWGTLQSTIPPVTAPAWATFYTGKNPGHHGVYHFYDIKEFALQRIKHDQTIIKNYSSITIPTIFDYFLQSDNKILSINMPMTYPPPHTNGNVISCWLAPPYSNDFTYPASLREEIPDYEIDLFWGRRLHHTSEDIKEISNPLNFFPAIISLLEKRRNTAIKLMEMKEWDLFMICFTETDLVQHFYMKLLQELKTNSKDVQHFKEFYRSLDDSINELIKRVGKDCTVLIISDHGFDQCVHTRVNINAWLRKEGLYSLKENVLSKIKKDYMNLSHVFKWHLNKLRGIRSRYSMTNVADEWIDWTRTQAFGISLHNMFGGIYLLESAYKNNQRRKIIEKLSLLRDLNGENVIKNIWRREEVVNGEYVNIYPDIIYEVENGYEAGGLPIDCCKGNIFDKKLGGLHEQCSYSNHNRDGIILAWGNKIKEDKRLPIRYSLQDCLPTIFYIMDMCLPSDCDGRIMEYLFTKEVLSSKDLKMRPPILNNEIIRQGTEDGYDEEVRNKLSNLGYI